MTLFLIGFIIGAAANILVTIFYIQRRLMNDKNKSVPH